MLSNLSRPQVIAAWFIGIAIVTLASIGLGGAATPGTWALLFLISLLPPALSFVVWQGAPPPTVAEVLYAARHQDGR